ncbi:hypothetical protein QSH18_16955 [Xanthomonas sp. NCPPB 2654]|uniref:hypothetical protein n=1 Tax=unclassified Xanthomonas TaxID=2643310 RepID=UPI0021E05240|nr:MULTISPECIES: hypothetical protein [unclassified Xanthomonas]MDL5367300.1 hypothetical protein [Xanthomonas sp. NCPPB 2654]UYC19578.1 hypothetical protein NUG20_15525 [Xanthomonas sp. CFBP 8443]
MKLIIFLTTLIISIPAFADDQANLIQAQEEIQAEFDEMTCSELKQDLPKLSESLDALRFINQGAVEFEIAIYTLKKTIEKSRLCIQN